MTDVKLKAVVDKITPNNKRMRIQKNEEGITGSIYVPSDDSPSKITIRLKYEEDS